VLASEEMLETIEQVPGADGRMRQWLVQKFPLLRTDQRTWVGGTAVDVTDRHEAEAALKASQQMLRIVLDSIPQGVFWKDRDSRFLGCNRVAARKRRIRFARRGDRQRLTAN